MSSSDGQWSNGSDHAIPMSSYLPQHGQAPYFDNTFGQAALPQHHQQRQLQQPQKFPPQQQQQQHHLPFQQQQVNITQNAFHQMYSQQQAFLQQQQQGQEQQGQEHQQRGQGQYQDLDLVGQGAANSSMAMANANSLRQDLDQHSHFLNSFAQSTMPQFDHITRSGQNQEPDHSQMHFLSSSSMYHPEVAINVNHPSQSAQTSTSQDSLVSNIQNIDHLHTWDHTEPSLSSASAPPSDNHEIPIELFNSNIAGQFPSSGTGMFPLLSSGHQMAQQRSIGESSGSIQRDEKPAALEFSNQHHTRHSSQPAYLNADPKMGHDLTRLNDPQSLSSSGSNWHTQYPQGVEMQQRSISADLLSPVHQEISQVNPATYHAGSVIGAGHMGNQNPIFQLHHQASFEGSTPTSSQHSGHSSNRPEHQHLYGAPLNEGEIRTSHSSSSSFEPFQPQQQQVQMQMNVDGLSSHSWFDSPAHSDISAFPSNQYTSHSPRKVSASQRQQHRQPSHEQHAMMMGSSQIAGLPTTPTRGVNEFDTTDYRLSAALANNAHISTTSTPTKAKPRPRQKQQLPQQGLIASESSQHTMQNGAINAMFHNEQEHLGHSHVQSSFEVLNVAASDHLSSEADHQSHQGTIKRYRPVIRPNIFQQYSTTPLLDEPSINLEDCTSFMGEVLSEYVYSPSRLGMGERSVLIMTSKVAQKSYGNEKRFLCPPPMVLLVGSSWWSSCQYKSRGDQQSIGQEEPGPTLLTPPRLNISMSGEKNNHDSPLEWASHSGRLIDVENPSSEMAISGRSIGRQLFVNDADEKRRHCEAIATITMPGVSISDRKLLGSFMSKPIKVISKPSKKRHSTRTSDFSVNHGSTISLFHRLRSQTVSTRYLCVSGAPTWFKGSDGEPFLNSDVNTHIPNQAEPASCFVAKMSSWDPFIIYLVDPHMEAPTTGVNSGKPAPVVGYPPPPSNILPIPAGNQGKPICYNQAVVLQCLNTAVVSPVMIIRKVEKTTTVVGGGQNFNPAGAIHIGGNRVDPTEEALGDPVSQLHKIAFETLEDPNAPVPIAENRDISTPGESGPFLGCLNEEVGLNRPLGSRQWAVTSMSGPSTPTTPSTPSMIPLTSSSRPSSAKSSDPFDAATRIMMMGSDSITNLEFAPSSSPMFAAGPSNINRHAHHAEMSYDQSLANSPGVSSDEGTGNKRARRVSGSMVVPIKERSGSSSSLSSLASTKNRRRGQSLSMLSMQKTAAAAAAAAASQQAQQLQFQQQQQNPFYDEHWAPQHQGQSHMQSSFSFTGLPGPSFTTNNASNEGDLSLRRTNSFAHSIANSEASSTLGGIPAGSLWSVEVHDSDIWTIVGVDIARHSFYIPTRLIGGAKSQIDAADQNIAHLINVPAPSSPITPIPVITAVQLPGPFAKGGDKSRKGKTASQGNIKGGGISGNGDNVITLIGEHFSDDFFVYFGDWRCNRVKLESDTTMYCEPPPPNDEYGLSRGRVPIIHVRKDGVVFPSRHTYLC